MNKHPLTAFLTIISTLILFIVPAFSFDHVIDERPGLGMEITLVLVMFWIAIVLSIVLIVRRMIRPDGGKDRDIEGRKEKK